MQLNRAKGIVRSHVYSQEVRFSEQFHYGHREVILNYFGFESDLCFKGSLQHGWIGKDAEGLIPRIYNKFGGLEVNLVWSQRVWEALKKEKNRKVLSIGSPWAHLHIHKESQRKSEKPRGKVNEARKDFLYIPIHSYHGWKGAPSAHRLVSYTNGLQGTVCLSWLDFLDAATRYSFEEMGFDVVCAGYRGSSSFETPSANVGGRRNFLPNLFDLIAECDLLIVDDIATPFWYGLSLSKTLIVLNREVEADYWDSKHAMQRRHYETIDLVTQFLKAPKIKAEMEISGEGVWYEIALKELGYEFVGRAREVLEESKLTFHLKHRLYE